MAEWRKALLAADQAIDAIRAAFALYESRPLRGRHVQRQDAAVPQHLGLPRPANAVGAQHPQERAGTGRSGSRTKRRTSALVSCRAPPMPCTSE